MAPVRGAVRFRFGAGSFPNRAIAVPVPGRFVLGSGLGSRNIGESGVISELRVFGCAHSVHIVYTVCTR